MRDPNYLLVGGQADEDKSDDESNASKISEDRERAEFIEAWKTMYRRKGLGPNNYHIDWGTVFEDERVE